MKRPVLIGLTGSIGMGKSTTARMFAEHNIPVWDADTAVHRLYAPDGAAVSAVADLCPSARSQEGGIDRGALKAWIAEDASALQKIEQVVHPLVAQDRAEFIARSQAPALVLDIPLLFETGADKIVDLVVVVSTAPETQRSRVLARPGMTEAQFDAILAKQLPDAEKRAWADVIILTDTMDSAQSGVMRVLQRIKALGANQDA